MSTQPQREQGNKGFFSLDGVMGDKLENACRNHKPVRLILSRGANVSGYIKSFDRQYAQAVIETENGECVIRLGYLIQVFVKNINEDSLSDYSKNHPNQKEKDADNLVIITSEKKYSLDLNAYIVEHKYQDKSEGELAEIIKKEPFNNTLKRVWLKQIGIEHFNEFVREQQSSKESS
jgi:hypothetical protein